ncbi:MAG: SIS domain-containing protein [Phycisphaeraceae bacterium]
MNVGLDRNLEELSQLLPKMTGLDAPLLRLGQAMLACWQRRGKVLIAGNGGSAADAMHFAEELVVRFKKNRQALAALALCDPTTITCAGNDFSFDHVFARQVEALGNASDMLIVMTTSGNSENLIRAVTRAKEQDMITAVLTGESGGRLHGMCDIELMIPTDVTHHVQEGHKILYHTLCQWIDEQVAY